MSKNYFTPIDLDAAFPVPQEPVKPPSGDPALDRSKVEAIFYINGQINDELSRIRSGNSKNVPTAQQFTESKTPFCIAITHLSGKSTSVDVLKVVALAKQDFGDKFANFVLELFKPLFGAK